ncbi:hypothetical protein R1sor_010801 [Riccia sorocarpa]|uniref:CRC domain-containing protein n=1 Tax=Riccia sorocarpa TaxID=122646 RepID=A0ABD3I2Y3_9MARC
MESPDRKDNIPPAVDQGSPFFKYLCNLSPIKSTRPRHVVQTYAELSMPPPPAIFTSPANPNKGGARVRRGLGVSNFVAQRAWGVDKENLPNHSFVARRFTAVQAETGNGSAHEAVAFVSASIKQGTGDKNEDPKLLDFGDVSEYISEPVDSGIYNNAPKASFFMVKTATIREEFQYQPGDDVEMSRQDEPTSSRASATEENSQEGPGSNVTTQASQESVQQSGEATRCSQRSGDGLGSRPSSDQRNGDDTEALQLDHETAAMAYLLVGDAESDGAAATDWSSGHQSALPDFAHQSPEFSPVERISDVANLSIRDELVEDAASNSLVNEALTVADFREVTEDESRNLLVSNSLSQRGVRRRCLDFETARRKSMGGGVPPKFSVSRSKTAGGPSELTTSSCIPPSVLYERAAASSDATNSSCAPALSVEPHSSTPRQPRSNGNITTVKSPGLLRLTSIQRATSDKVVVETTRTVIESATRRTGPSGIGLHLNSLHLNSGLHLNSLTGSISFSPQKKEVSRSLSIATAPQGAVASLLGIPELSRLSNDLGRDGFTDVGNVSNCFTINSSAALYGSSVSVPFLDRSLTTSRDVTPAIKMAHEASKGNDIHSSGVGSRQSFEGNRSTGHDKSCPTGKKRLLHHDVQPVSLDFTEEFESPRSPKKKRKSLAGEKSGEGCKRCNCKKSKCLKLYCECFAAGTYCVGSCTCQDCFNKPEHEETVLATRQQIESRNPLAFAPKIIHAADSSPKRGEEIIDTPASARHKRGCNCKKSRCLKKYCECYQAGVGCSEGCRCEGCKNVYGLKEANEEGDEKDIFLEAIEKTSQEDRGELPKPGCRDGGPKLDLQRHRGKDLSPITPSVEYTGQGRTIGRTTRSTCKKRSSSPCPQRTSPRSLRKCVDYPLSPKEVRSDSGFAVQQDPDFHLSKIEPSPSTTPKFTRISQLSPRWERLGDICTLTPLPQAPVRPTPASISTLDRSGASPCFNRQGMETVSSYKGDIVDFTSSGKPSSFQLPPDDSPPSPSNKRYSFSHQTPCTPSVTTAPPFTAKDDMKFDDNRSAQFGVYPQDDDDTPAFLRYSETAMSPVITKNGSPKQKRVSPPHFEGLRDRPRGDGRNIFESPVARLSPGLRSGRKFILTSISGSTSTESSMGPTVQGHIGR